MTATNLGLGGQPIRFLGAYVRNISTSLGLSGNSSSMTVTLVEDISNGIIFQPVEPGTFVTLEVGPTFIFSGMVQKYTEDVRNISGRQIQVIVNDVRDAMRAIPMIIAPGFRDIADLVNANTGCSVLDVFGAFDDLNTGLNLSGYTDAGIFYDRIRLAMEGGSLIFSTFSFDVPQQTVKAFGEQYRFNMSEVTPLVDPDYLVNSNLITVADFINELGNKHAFDWYVEMEEDVSGVIGVKIKVIDRAQDNIDIDLQNFLDSNSERVISATSGLELRNDLACAVVQGAPVENLVKVEVQGLANEPIDLSPEGGDINYVMTETEMRVVLAGRHSWETWLSIATADGGGGGFSRYGGTLAASGVVSMVNLSDIVNQMVGGNLPKNPQRTQAYLESVQFELAGTVYEKLKGHAETTYGKRWVHAPILDEIIESAWTRDVVAGNNDPNEFFRQDDGRTRAYIEFTSDPQGGAFNLGLGNLQNVFGNNDLFRNVTAFGTTFSNVLPGDPGQTGATLVLELDDNFNANEITTDLDRADYIYDNATTIVAGASAKTSFYVAATVDRDGTVRIDAPVFESAPDMAALLTLAVLSAKDNSGIPDNADAFVLNIRGESINTLENRFEQTSAERNALIDQKKALEEQIRNLTIAGLDTLLLQTDLAAIIFQIAEKTGEIAAIASMLAFKRRQEEFDSEGDLVEAIVARQKRAQMFVLNRNAIFINNQDADGNPVEPIKDALLKWSRLFGLSMFDINPRSYQPTYAYIPTRSRILRYGPAFPSNIDINSQGKLEIIQDDGFSPWEFGSISAMQVALQKKVDSATSLQKTLQSATVVVENFPQFNIGQSLGFNSNINNISISFGNDGVRTTYNLQSFTRKFGELTKEEIARDFVYNVASARRVLPQNTVGSNERQRFGVNKNFTGRGSLNRSAVKGGSQDFG